MVYLVIIQQQRIEEIILPLMIISSLHLQNRTFVSERIIDSEDIHNELWLKPCSDLL